MGSVPTQLWSTSDIGNRIGVSRERARQLIAGPDFPDPVQATGRTRLWDPDDVEAWITEHRPEATHDDIAGIGHHLSETTFLGRSPAAGRIFDLLQDAPDDEITDAFDALQELRRRRGIS